MREPYKKKRVRESHCLCLLPPVPVGNHQHLVLRNQWRAIVCAEQVDYITRFETPPGTRRCAIGTMAGRFIYLKKFSKCTTLK